MVRNRSKLYQWAQAPYAEQLRRLCAVLLVGMAVLSMGCAARNGAPLSSAPTFLPEPGEPERLHRRRGLLQQATRVEHGRGAQATKGPSARSSTEQDGWEQLLTDAGLAKSDERPVPGGPLTRVQAARVLQVLLKTPVTLGTFPARMAVGHLLRQALEQGDLSRQELLRRVERFSRVAVLRPDGYLAWVRTGRTQQKAFGGRVQWREGSFRAGPFELGRFYVARGSLFLLADEWLEPLEGPVRVEVYDDADYISRALDGAQAAFVAMTLAVGELLTHPVDSLAALQNLPAGVAALIHSSPEYLERFRYMTRGEQVQVVAELTTTLLVTKGTASATTRTVTGGLAGAEATVPVLALSANGVLVLERMAVPVGRGASVLGGGPGAAILLHRANADGGGASSSQGPGRWESANEYMEEPARRYQKQITDASEGQVYTVEDVKFDGFKDGILLEAKGPGYRKHLDDAVENGGWFGGFRAMVTQAQRQLGVSQGFPIQWHFAEREVADFVRVLFRRNGLDDISVIFTSAQ